MLSKKSFLVIAALVIVFSITACSGGSGDISEENDSKSILKCEEVIAVDGLGGAMDYYNANNNLMTEDEKQEFGSEVLLELVGECEMYGILPYIEKTNLEYPMTMQYADYLYEGLYDSESNKFNYGSYSDDEYLSQAFTSLSESDLFIFAKAYFFENEAYDDGFIFTVNPRYLDTVIEFLGLVAEKDDMNNYYIEGEPLYGFGNLTMPSRIIKGQDDSWKEDDMYATVMLESNDNINVMQDAWKTTVLIPVELVNDDSQGPIIHNDMDGDKYLANYEHFIDLNSDGVDELVMFNTKSMRYISNAFSINDDWVYFDDIDIIGELTYNRFKIINLDENDNRMEIMVESSRPPYEIEYSILAYYPDLDEGERIQNLISIDTEGNEPVFRGDGTFYTRNPSAYIEDASIDYEYMVNPDGAIVSVVSEGATFEYVEGIHDVAVKDFTVNLETDEDSISVTIAEGQGFTIHGENMEGWLIISPDNDQNSRFWINPEILNHIDKSPFEKVRFWS